MPEIDEDSPAGSRHTAPSKSALKRQMHALQKLGETLVGLSDRQLDRVPIEDARLLEAVREARSMRSHGARRRHLQLIGKLMRDIDAEPIEKALELMDRQKSRDADAFQELEKLREEVLEAGLGGIERVMDRWPRADRQHLRQLLLQHQREKEHGKPPAASRKLFRYLRELRELYGVSG